VVVAVEAQPPQDKAVLEAVVVVVYFKRLVFLWRLVQH
jgi:hypothetical protein